MTQIDLSKLIYHSSFSGLGSSSTTSISSNIPSSTVGLSPTVFTASVLFSNKGSVSQVEIQFTGLDSVWYIFKGHLENFYTSGNVWTNNIVNTAYGVDIDSSYTSNSLVLTISLYNYSISPTVTTPAFTVNCNASLYNTPF